MDFGIMFFSSADERIVRDKYKLVIEATKIADAHDFCCVWTPERHFHKFGGLFPNPAVLSAALAMITTHVQIRAGSIISPLHNPIRLAEDWSIVDNLANGRLALSFGSGWNVDDFVFFPERYETRHIVMWQQIQIIKNLWRGQSITQKNSYGKDVKVKLHPRPVQKELSIWITSGGNVGTFINAGMIGANILTQFTGHTIESLAGKIRSYRDALAMNGFDPQQGRVAVMLHTFIGLDLETVRDKVRVPFREYLRSAVSLEQKAAIAGGVISGGHTIDPHDVPNDMMDDLLDTTFEWYFNHGSLMGTRSSCRTMIEQLSAIGVDEIACLIDFLDDDAAVLDGVKELVQLKAEC